jgi:uncharacterized protein YndB with AHSA1/START domain
MSEPVRTSVTISASVPRVMEVVSDLENTDRWANEAQSADVEERDAEGRPSRITVTLGAIGFSTKATYTVAYTENTVTMECVHASLIRESTIVYTATDQGDGTTLLEMSTTMVVTVPVPQWGLEKAMHRSAEKNLASVRKDAEAGGS